MTDKRAEREALALRVVWMLLFAIVWKVAELVLLLTALAQLLLRLINGRPSRALMAFGDSLSQFLAQSGRYVTFHTEHKPWPFSDWPSASEPAYEIIPVAPVAPVAPATAAQPVPAAVTETLAEATVAEAVAADEVQPASEATEAVEPVDVAPVKPRRASRARKAAVQTPPPAADTDGDDAPSGAEPRP